MACPPDSTLSPKEVARLANAVEFTGDGLDWAVAVSFAENQDHCPSSVHLNDNGTYDIGLWQINTVHQADHPNWTIQYLQDPGNNAKAAFTVSSGGKDWTPWATFKSGLALSYLQAAKKANGEVQSGSEGFGGAIGDAASKAADPLVQVAKDVIGVAENVGNIAKIIEFPIKAGLWIVHNIKRVIEGLLGGIAIYVGIKMINDDLKDVVDKVSTAASAVYPSGATPTAGQVAKGQAAAKRAVNE